MSKKELCIFTLERFMEANETNFRGWTPVAELTNLYGGDKQTLYFSAQENNLSIMFKYSNFYMACSLENTISLTQLMLHKTLLVEFCEESRTFACIGYKTTPEDHDRALSVVMDNTHSTYELRYCESLLKVNYSHDVIEFETINGDSVFFDVSVQEDDKQKPYIRLRQRLGNSRNTGAEVIYKGDEEMFNRTIREHCFVIRQNKHSFSLINRYMFKESISKVLVLNREINAMTNDINNMGGLANKG